MLYHRQLLGAHARGGAPRLIKGFLENVNVPAIDDIFDSGFSPFAEVVDDFVHCLIVFQVVSLLVV